MGWYLVKLAVLLPVLGGLVWGSLRLWRLAQTRLRAAAPSRAARVVEVTLLAPGVRLAVIAFRGREVLVGCTRGGLTRLADVPASPVDGLRDERS
ncbi:flagellar biogenesis protein [Erythrobacteraceae bacterium CFH 75059]|uniref:flagellar biosynthetic protein FliO n=1 Tax=Qipengyuania thermophila TaxID=2509361 RepID=UPI001021F460|nr:flagellar biosynthetic protein FliO [Qipengyuania thermophila]TCD06302.1 flagellar biogenesis protein [Erythrobacteraceae bacterium CFH 75059]